MERLLNLLGDNNFPQTNQQRYIADFQTMNTEDRKTLLQLLELTKEFGTGD